MRKEIALVLFIFLTAFPALKLPSQVRATQTIRVPENFPTIQQAIDASSPGGIVLVAPGTYHENITVPKPLTIKGESAYSTILEKVDTFAVCHITSDNVIITGFRISGGSVGIWIDSSDLNTLSQNIIKNNDDGIWVTKSNSNNISNNVVADNFFYGLYLESSNYTTLERNNITRNIYGIYMETSKNCSIADNNITLNDVDGIHAARSTFNVILRNTIGNNSCGICLEESSSNVIHKNNLWHNIDQVQTEGVTSIWDDGYPSGGNFWSDYSGSDIDRDGIGNTPYVIDASNQDNYPLMKTWFPPDIAVSSAAKTKTVVCQGYTFGMNATFVNEGNKLEAFQVTIYANSTIVKSQFLMLANLSSRMQSFSLSTSGFAKGNYTVKVYAVPIQSEVHISDNSLSDGWIIVSMVGDITSEATGYPDGRCDLSDVYVICKRFGRFYPSPKYVPNYDLNNDLRIDMSDIYIVCTNFGEIDP